jgi:DNA-binding transcriptional MerR regulator
MGGVITIGKLARYAGVSVKAVRVYHAKGLLPEPERDASGYRRYTAEHAVELIKIRTLAEAGVPLARIKDLGDVRDVLADVDRELTARIRRLRETQKRLRRLAEGPVDLLPAEVGRHLDTLPSLGFGPRWVAMERDLWILLFATHPDLAGRFFRDQADALTDPALRQLYLDADRVHDLPPGDPAVDDLAVRIVDATRRRYGPGPLPGTDTPSEIPALMQDALNASSPAWRRLDRLIRAQLAAGT